MAAFKSFNQGNQHIEPVAGLRSGFRGHQSFDLAHRPVVVGVRLDRANVHGALSDRLRIDFAIPAMGIPMKRIETAW